MNNTNNDNKFISFDPKAKEITLDLMGEKEETSSYKIEGYDEMFSFTLEVVNILLHSNAFEKIYKEKHNIKE